MSSVQVHIRTAPVQDSCQKLSYSYSGNFSNLPRRVPPLKSSQEATFPPYGGMLHRKELPLFISLPEPQVSWMKLHSINSQWGGREGGNVCLQRYLLDERQLQLSATWFSSSVFWAIPHWKTTESLYLGSGGSFSGTRSAAQLCQLSDPFLHSWSQSSAWQKCPRMTTLLLGRSLHI